MKNGLEDQYVIKNNKRLRYGYTTGSCAAGAARGAVRMLLSGETLSEVELDTPKGITLTLQLHDITRGETYVSCADSNSSRKLARAGLASSPIMIDSLPASRAICHAS